MSVAWYIPRVFTRSLSGCRDAQKLGKVFLSTQHGNSHTAKAEKTSSKGQPLKGKLAIVTGASRGLGTAIAENLASKGCSLLLGYASSAQKAEAVASGLRARYGVKAVPAGGNVSTEEGCADIISTAKQEFTNSETGNLQIDIIVNNAGIAHLRPLGAITSDFFNEIYATNVLGPIFLVQACMPYLPHDRSGRIVNLSSVGCPLGLREQTVYAGSKGALEAMTRVWARELAERAVVNSVNPGPVLTDIYRGTPEDIKMLLGQWNQVSPLATIRPDDSLEIREWERFGGRPAYATEVAGTVAMLCSEDAGWTTGSVVSANGGMRFSY